MAAARRAVEHFTASNIEGLVLDLKPGRDAEDQRIIDTIEQLDAMLVDRLKFAQQIAGLLAPVPGLNAVTEVPSGDDIDQLRKTLREFLATGLRPALPVSICTPEGKTPPRVKTASGQWIGSSTPATSTSTASASATSRMSATASPAAASRSTRHNPSRQDAARSTRPSAHY